MTKADFIDEVKAAGRKLLDENDLDNVYELAYKAQYVADDEDLAEAGRLFVISADDFVFALEEIVSDFDEYSGDAL